MPRPSKGERSPITLRLAPDVLAKVDEAAKTAGLDRQAWIEIAIGEQLTGRPGPPLVKVEAKPKSFEVRLKEVARCVGFDPVSGERIYR